MLGFSPPLFPAALMCPGHGSFLSPPGLSFFVPWCALRCLSLLSPLLCSSSPSSTCPPLISLLYLLPSVCTQVTNWREQHRPGKPHRRGEQRVVPREQSSSHSKACMAQGAALVMHTRTEEQARSRHSPSAAKAQQRAVRAGSAQLCAAARSRAQALRSPGAAALGSAQPPRSST
jgi:hypothetical protein